MGEKTGIQWTDDTLNPIRARNRETGRVGHYCQKISPGCVNCYAETWQGWRGNGAKYDARSLDSVELYLDEKTLTLPLRQTRPRKIFICDMTDLFGEWVPDEWIDRIFAVMALAPQHTFQVLTKRATRMRNYLKDGFAPTRIAVAAVRMRSLSDAAELAIAERIEWGGNEKGGYIPMGLQPWPLPNVWLGVSAEDQQRLDERVPELLATPAAVRFVSAEPLLGPLEFAGHLWCSLDYDDPKHADCDALDWVIVGGESGPNARPLEMQWVRSIRDDCREAGVALFMKQFGAYIIDRNDNGFDGDEPWAWPMDTRHEDLTAQGWQGDPVRVRLRHPKGGNPEEWPEDLRVREWPSLEA